MHQSEVPTAGIGLFPGEGGFKQDGAAVQEIIARRVKLFLSQLKYFFSDFLSILGYTFNPFTVFNNESKFSMYSGKLLASGEITPRLKTYILCEGRW